MDGLCQSSICSVIANSRRFDEAQAQPFVVGGAQPCTAPPPIPEIIVAAHLGDNEKVRELLVAGKDPNTVRPDKKGESALHIAATDGNAELINLLLDYEADIEIGNEFQDKPLHNAAWSKQTDCLLLLLERGADINGRDQYGWTPLHKAARTNSVEASEALIDCCAIVDSVERRDQTPLHIAVEHENVGVARVLIQRGANVNACDRDGYSVLRRASACDYEEMKRLFRAAENSTGSMQSVDVASQGGVLEGGQEKDCEAQAFAKDIAEQLTNFVCDGYSSAQRDIYKTTVLKNSNRKYINMRVLRSRIFSPDCLARKLLDGLTGDGAVLQDDDGRLVLSVDWISSVRREETGVV